MPDQTVTAKFMADISDFQSKMRALQASAKEAQASAKELSTGLSQSGTGMQEVGQNAERASSGVREMGTSAREAGGGLNEMVGHISQSIGDWQQLVSMAAQFVQWADKMNQDAKDTANAFTALTGSAQKAQEALKSLNNTWASAAFGTKAVADVEQHFLMLGKDAQTTQKEIERVGDALAAMGKDGKQLQPAIEQMHKIQESTRASKEDIDQLADDGVAAWKALAEGLSVARGKTVDVGEAIKEVKSGAISGDEAYKAMMTGMMDYSGAAEEKSKDLNAEWQRFGEEAAPAIGPFIEELTKFLHAVNETIEGVKQLKQAIDSLGGGNNVLGSIGTGIMNTGLDPLGMLGGPARSGFISPLQFLGQYASGGSDLPSGWRVVGEDGPELQYSQGGDTIIPNGEDPASFLSGRGGSAFASIGNISAAMEKSVTTIMQSQDVTLHVKMVMPDGRLMAEQTIPHIAPMLRRQFGRRV
jgi:tape measure domain-containing protein